MERVQRSAEAIARRAFAAGVSSLPGPKTLFVEAALYDTRTSSALCVRAFADPAFLAEHGVREVVPLPSSRADILLCTVAPRAAVFLLRGASARGARNIVKALRLRAQDASPLRCTVLVTPRLSATVQRVFDGAGYPELSTSPLPLGFLPYDADVLTLDWPAAYKELVLHGDASAILAAAGGLTAIADAFRLRFAPIRSAGPAAAAVAEQLLETHGRRYARPRGVAANRRQASLQTSPASPAPLATPVRNAFLPRAFSLLTPPAASDTDDDATSTYGSEFYAFSDGDTRSQSVGGQSQGAPTLGDLNEARRPRNDVPLVLIDRGVDIASALLSQWTYEGLLDEALGLGNNQLVVPVSELRTEDAAGVLKPTAAGADVGVMQMQLRADSDPLFAQVRDLSYWAAARRIGEVASGVKEYYSARPERATSEIAAVKSYVAGLREKTSAHRRASEHVALAAEISRRTFECAPFKRRFEFERELLEGGSATVRRVFIAEMIARGESLPHVLRLACLWSVTSAGVDAEFFDSVRREIAAAFGLTVLPLLANLERAGLFARTKSKSSNAGWLGFSGLGGGGAESPPRQEDVDDTASVASFQSSATARSNASLRSSRTSATSVRSRVRHSPTLAPRSSAVTHSWQFARAALRLVTTFDPDEEPAPGDRPAAPYLGYTPLSVRLIEAALSPDGWARLPPGGPNTALLPVGHAAVEHRAAGPPATKAAGGIPFDAVVVFVGGVTRAEASATRMAAEIAGKRVLILATHVIGADEFVESFAEEA